MLKLFSDVTRNLVVICGLHLFAVCVNITAECLS